MKCSVEGITMCHFTKLKKICLLGFVFGKILLLLAVFVSVFENSLFSLWSLSGMKKWVLGSKVLRPKGPPVSLQAWSCFNPRSKAALRRVLSSSADVNNLKILSRLYQYFFSLAYPNICVGS